MDELLEERTGPTWPAVTGTAPGLWATEAACGGLPGFVEFPAGARAKARLETICRACPVLEACRAYADGETLWGWWAGRWRDGHRTKRKAA